MAAPTATNETPAGDAQAGRPSCCSLYHHAIELIGKRWPGAIVLVLMDGPFHFSQYHNHNPKNTDHQQTERLK